MAAVTVCSDSGAQESKICHCLPFPLLFDMTWWDQMPQSSFFLMLSFKPAFSLSSFTLIKKLFSFSSLPAIRAISSAYLQLLTFLPAILIPACASSKPALQIMYSAQKSNKQDDNITALTYSFPNFEPVCCSVSSSNCYFLICIVLDLHRSALVRWSGIPISWRIFQSLSKASA